MDRIVVVGGGGHAKVVVGLLKKLLYTVLGYTDRQDRGRLLGAPYLGDDGVLRGLLGRAGASRSDRTSGDTGTQPGDGAVVFPAGGSQAAGAAGGGLHAALGVGKVDASIERLAMIARLAELGLVLPLIVSPAAVVNEEVELGEGTIVGDGVVVNSGTRVGRACILNTHSTVEHDCALGDNVHVAPGATLNGGVVVGDNTFIGSGATVVHYVAICAGCLIGAGSTVVADITEPGVYVGSPARRIR